MNPVSAIKTGVGKTFVFTGRASRPAFWWFAPGWLLLAFAIHLPINAYLTSINRVMESFVLLVAFCIPALSAGARRAVDANLSQSWAGWGFGGIFFGLGLMNIAGVPANITGQTWFTPVGALSITIGALILVVVMTRPSKSGHDLTEVIQ